MKTRYDEIHERAVKFHKEHPIVWKLFQKFTFEKINLGFQHYSGRTIWELIRWHTEQVPGAERNENEFKLNDHYFPFYTRAFMNKYPEHEGFFRTRKQISKDEAATGLDPLGPDYFDNQ